MVAILKLKQLPLHPLHVKAGAHLGAFGEWEVPLYFTSILDEHESVRTRAGVFDISHMGEFFIQGSKARQFLDELLPRRMDRLKEGKALYAPLLNDAGGVVDDLIVYQLNPENYLLIVNAANIGKDFDWIRRRLPGDIELQDISDEKCLLALQGPNSQVIAEALFHRDLNTLRYYHFLILNSAWGELLISRTGYTGEDGFEIMTGFENVTDIWKSLFEAGKSFGLKPIGFGARDTLRLEAGMLLYGQDMNDSTSAMEAGLEWAVDFDKNYFVGQERNLEEKKKGAARRLIGFELVERGIPRHGCVIKKEGRPVGEVTSGSFSPTLKKSIGMGYVSAKESQNGNEIEIEIRNQNIKARITPLPFYKRPATKMRE